jgi:cystathionine gamma-synthase
MAGAEVGELKPHVTIQQDERACLSANLLWNLGSDSGKTEEDISRTLIEDGLYERGIGSSLFPARVLSSSLNKIGLEVNEVYGTQLPGENETNRAAERLASIDKALGQGQKVMLAFAKQREGQAPFTHYCMVTGYRETPAGNGVTIMDPSDIDGGIKHPSWEELLEYVTPLEDCPVMAWGISPVGETKTVPEPSRQAGLPGFSLMAEPLYKKEDTGKAIPPGTAHPSGVVMPTAEVSRDFNKLGDVVLAREGELPFGYPRFVVPPVVKELSLKTRGRMDSLPFPTRRAAEGAVYPEKTFQHLRPSDVPAVDITEKGGLFWLDASQFNTEAWQHTGLGISSRQAIATLEGRPDNNLERGDAAEQKIRGAIETYTGAKPEDTYLFPTGMAAIYWLNQALIKIAEGAPGAQFGFPYTDSYEQRRYGPHNSAPKNVLDFRDGDYARLRHATAGGQRLRGVMTEYPTNPLLWTPNLERLESSLNGETPIIVDDTVGTMFNLDDTKLPDSVAARVTSLTKFFSSVGDVMGGSIILRPESPHYEQLKAALEEIYEDTLWYEDAEALAANSELFPAVMPTINDNGRALARWLHEEWTGDDKLLQAVYHPSLTAKRAYNALKKPGAGYGGLLSLRFNDPEQGYSFFDELRVTKGPSLGTYYTLGCLYTYLAHKPVESVGRFGVVPDLVRLSLGIEDIDDLKDRTGEALQATRR